MNKEILVADDIEDNLEVLEMYLESEFQNEIITFSSGNETIRYLENNEEIAIVIADLNMSDGNGSDLYEWIKENRPEVPFLLVSGDDPSELDNYPILEEYGKEDPTKPYLKKPFDQGQFIDLVKKIITGEIEPEVKQYKRIGMDRFLLFQKALVDAFIKISNTKFVKVFTEGDDNPEEVVKKYNEKGIRHLWIEDHAYSEFMNRASAKIHSKLSNQDLKTEDVMSYQMDTVESIHSSLKNLGVSSNAMEVAEKSMNATMSALKKDKKVASLLSKLFGNKKGYINELGTMMSYLTISIAECTDWSSPQNFEKLSFCSLVQDVSLEDDDLAKIIFLDSEEYDNLTKIQKNKVKDHAMNSVKLLENLDNFNSDCKNIILEHHERPKGDGFPRKITQQKITPLSCIFILAHEFAHTVLSEKMTLDRMQQLHKKLEEEFSTGNFKKPYDGFKKSFKKS